MYIFSTDEKTISLFLKNTSSGNVCVNDVIMNVAGIKLVIYSLFFLLMDKI